MSPYVRVSRTSHEPLIHLSNNKTPRVLPISATLFISSSLVSNERSILPSSRTRAIFQPSRHLGGDREESQSEGEGGRGCIQCFSFTPFFFFLFFCGAKNRGQLHLWSATPRRDPGRSIFVSISRSRRRAAIVSPRDDPATPPSVVLPIELSLLIDSVQWLIARSIFWRNTTLEEC